MRGQYLRAFENTPTRAPLDFVIDSASLAESPD